MDAPSHFANLCHINQAKFCWLGSMVAFIASLAGNKFLFGCLPGIVIVARWVGPLLDYVNPIGVEKSNGLLHDRAFQAFWPWRKTLPIPHGTRLFYNVYQLIASRRTVFLISLRTVSFNVWAHSSFSGTSCSSFNKNFWISHFYSQLHVSTACTRRDWP